MNPYISLIVPTCNEEKRIEPTIDSYVFFFSKEYPSYEIIFVCNYCRDNTIEIIKKKKNKHIKILNFPQRLGKGGAILKGLEIAKGKIIGFMDADDAFEHPYIKRMIGLLENNKADCVIASKWKGKTFSQVLEPTQRKLLAMGWNLLSKILLGIKFKDTQAGAKFFTKKALNSINKNFICRGFDFDVELLWRFKKQNLKITEAYVPNKPLKFSTFRLRFVPGMFFNIIRLWWLRLRT